MSVAGYAKSTTTCFFLQPREKVDTKEDDRPAENIVVHGCDRASPRVGGPPVRCCREPGESLPIAPGHFQGLCWCMVECGESARGNDSVRIACVKTLL